jgi:hypothetical protein
MILPLILFLFFAFVALRRYLLAEEGSKRKFVARYKLEERVLKGDKVKHQEEFVSAPGKKRKGQVLYRQIWSPLGENAKGVVVLAHGINAYSGRFAKDAVVMNYGSNVFFFNLCVEIL